MDADRRVAIDAVRCGVIVARFRIKLFERLTAGTCDSSSKSGNVAFGGNDHCPESHRAGASGCAA